MSDTKGSAEETSAAAESDTGGPQDSDRIRDPKLRELGRRMKAGAAAAEEIAREAWALADSLPAIPRPIRS